jgi:cysteine-rich repeat protein
MRKLCVALALLGGCVFVDDDDNSSGHYCGDLSIDAPFETCDDGNAIDGDGCSATCQKEGDLEPTYITASWSIKTVAGVSGACPTGYDTAAVYTQPMTAAGAPVGTPYVDLFDCAPKIGTIAPVPPGLYLSWVEIVNNAGTQVYAKSLSTPIDTTTGDQQFAVMIYTDGGYFQFAWSLVGATSNSALTCMQAGATGGVELVGTDIANSSNAASDQYDCENGSGVSDAYLQGTYTVSIKALNGSDQAIGAAPNLTNRVIQGPNHVTDLGTVQIPITGL